MSGRRDADRAVVGAEDCPDGTAGTSRPGRIDSGHAVLRCGTYWRLVVDAYASSTLADSIQLPAPSCHYRR